MRRLILLRHAKAIPYVSGDDWLRPLLPSGMDDALAAGRELANYSIDLAYVSTAKRTEQTWHIACRGGAAAARVENVDWLYGASTSKLVREVTSLPDDLATVLFVGHEPGMSSVALELAAPTEPVAELVPHLPTASMIVLTYEGDWAEMLGVCKLEHVYVRQ